MTSKQQAIKALNNLARSIQCIERPAFQAKHKDWLATELLSFAELNGITLAVGPPGEGVRVAAAAGNLNQSPPPSKNPQCPLEATPSKGYWPKADLYGRATEARAMLTTVSWSDGVTTVYDHKGEYEMGKEGVIVGSLSGGEGQETSKVSIEAPGAREGHRLMTHVGGGALLVNRMGGETPGETAARGVADCPSPQARQEVTPWSDPGIPVTFADINDTNAPPAQVFLQVAPLWPKEARVSVLGPTLNPRLCSGALIEEGDRLGRKVTIWKGRFFYKSGSILKCKLDLVQGDDARYLPV
jgi:hypothetical protein